MVVSKWNDRESEAELSKEAMFVHLKLARFELPHNAPILLTWLNHMKIIPTKNKQQYFIRIF